MKIAPPRNEELVAPLVEIDSMVASIVFSCLCKRNATDDNLESVAELGFAQFLLYKL